MLHMIAVLYISEFVPSADGKINTQSLENYYILFATHDGNQNPHTGDLVEHTGTFLP
jgi:hypothetical protein